MIKLALDILGDKETREKIGIVILSIVVGVVLLLFAPVAVLMTMGEIDPPDVSGNFDQSAWIQSLDSEQQDKIAQMESAGQQIASAMESVGVREQTIKAQLIYISCFEDVTVDDFNSYANLFKNAPDDAALINSINQNYGLEIVYEDYMRSYALISHVVINPYMFTDVQTKNSTDLVIWARQAYENGWGYVYGTYGNILTEKLRNSCRTELPCSENRSQALKISFVRTGCEGERQTALVSLKAMAGIIPIAVKLW